MPEMITRRSATAFHSARSTLAAGGALLGHRLLLG